MFKKTFLSLLLSIGFGSNNFKYSYNVITTNEEINIDGNLDELVWKTGTSVSNFSQKDPQPGEPARQKTEVRVVIDNEFIYVGAYLFDNSPDSIAKQILRKDGWGY